MRAVCFEIPRFRRVLAAIVLAHLLAVVAMAASPALHEWTHADAHEDGHECAVVLFASGGVEAAVVVGFVVALVAKVVSRGTPRSAWVPSVFRVQRILEHAPPRRA